jgi:hypothetical protein
MSTTASPAPATPSPPKRPDPSRRLAAASSSGRRLPFARLSAIFLDEIGELLPTMQAKLLRGHKARTCESCHNGPKAPG